MDSIFNDFILGSWVQNGVLTRSVRAASRAVAAMIVGGAVSAGSAAASTVGGVISSGSIVASNLDPRSFLTSDSEVGWVELQLQVSEHPAISAGREIRNSIILNIERLSADAEVEFDPEMLSFAEDALSSFRKRK